jgi:two-component system response regulator FixJ
MITSPNRQPHERPDLRKALESAGFVVFDASDASRERKRLREFWASLILLGLPMPRMGGLEVFRRLRSTGHDAPEAIILAHGRIPEVTSVLRLGALDVLARQLAPEVVRGVVEGIVRGAGGPLPGSAQPSILVAVDPLSFKLRRAKQALERREFGEAERLLRNIIALDPEWAAAHNLMGVIHQSLGEHRASCQSFRAALRADGHYEPALENLRRYCERFGRDFQHTAFDSPNDFVEPPRPLGRWRA